MRAGDCYVETFVEDNGEWGWQCFDCETEDAGFANLGAAEAAGEHHRVEVATQELIDAEELP